MMIGLLRIFAIICVASVCGKLISKVKLPAILGWLIAGIVFGPYLRAVDWLSTVISFTPSVSTIC